MRLNEHSELSKDYTNAPDHSMSIEQDEYQHASGLDTSNFMKNSY